MATTLARIVGPRDGKLGILGGIGVRFMVDGAESGGGFSLVEHPMEPRALAAPMHRHSREDEYSFVLQGRVGADLGGEIVYGEIGDLIFKPRGQWHTFWNAADTPARILAFGLREVLRHYGGAGRSRRAQPGQVGGSSRRVRNRCRHRQRPATGRGAWAHVCHGTVAPVTTRSPARSQ